jgi:hypothetical protein
MAVTCCVRGRKLRYESFFFPLHFFSFSFFVEGNAFGDIGQQPTTVMGRFNTSRACLDHILRSSTFFSTDRGNRADVKKSEGLVLPKKFIRRAFEGFFFTS